jgi:hypothetical protein
MNRDANLYQQGKSAVVELMRRYRRGAYRVIRDPEGEITLWKIEGYDEGHFSLSFANKGRISGNLEDMPPEFVKSFVSYVRKKFNR